MFMTHQTIMLVASWWATTNKLLFDTYVNNKLPREMPSVVEFNYQLATYVVYFPLSYPCPLLSYVHVKA